VEPLPPKARVELFERQLISGAEQALEVGQQGLISPGGLIELIAECAEAIGPFALIGDPDYELTVLASKLFAPFARDPRLCFQARACHLGSAYARRRMSKDLASVSASVRSPKMASRGHTVGTPGR
jgi:hypothetical protein